MKHTRDESIEKTLSALLDALALVLLKLGITPGKLSHIARASFVKAGVRQALKRSSGRPHLARIAALTALSRSEVKRIIAANYAVEDYRADTAPRALRVLAAWRQSSQYLRRGKPVQLKIAGRAPSFVSLCRDHSGDIPHRVILDALERDNLVKVNEGRTQVSIAPRKMSLSKNKADLAALSFAAGFLEEALREDAIVVRRRQRVRTSSTVPRGYVEKAIASRVIEFMDQIPNLFPTARSRKKDSIDVFAVVARNNWHQK